MDFVFSFVVAQPALVSRLPGLRRIGTWREHFY
jgi:hypothetical protein